NNGVAGIVTQAFTLLVQQPASFTSAAAATFTAGGPPPFTVTPAGVPVPSLSPTRAPPSGIPFTPNRTSTATPRRPPAGRPRAPTDAQPAPAPTDGAPPPTRLLPPAVNDRPGSTGAPVGRFGSVAASTFTISTVGPPVPLISNGSPLPTGVTFTNNGDGTAT